MRRGGGEIVEVHGGHIVRSTGRKDRHSKVCTAKGPRDRRVRLSAPTAIQFYDVQDRLGFDRPSKAVDWLIKKAKAAIDKLAELPAWKPTATAVPPSDGLHQQQQQPSEEEGSKDQMQTLMGQDDEISPTTMNDLQQQNQQQMGENHQLTGSSFLPTVDNIKSFLPTGQPSPSSLNFQSFPQNLIPRTSGSGLNQDLQLSLQSYHNPALLPQHQSHHTQQDQAIFSGPTQLGFDGSSAAGGWSSESEHHHHAPPSEMGLFQKILAWNAADDVSGSSIGGGAGGGGGGGGFPFSSPPSMQLHILQPLGPKNQFFLQRGPLQSSDTPSIRAWIDPGINLDHHHHHHHQINPPAVHHLPALPVTGFALGGFSGFQIQARIQGDQEERDGIPNQLSSASSDSCH